MEQRKVDNGMLDLMTRPGFFVEDDLITQVNGAAASLLLTPGTDVRTLLLTGQEEYADFQEGCLYLQLNLIPGGVDATVTYVDGTMLFLLEERTDRELQAMALAARELRNPLTGMMISAERLAVLSLDNSLRDDLARLNRGLFQMLRLIGNMSDAGQNPDATHLKVVNLSAVMNEIFQKAAPLVLTTGVKLNYRGLDQEVLSLADPERLERAVLNILSNAVKYTPKRGAILATLTRQGKLLRLQIADSGSGISPEVRSTLFHRYQRQPGIEDGRTGIGLGMVLIRSAAACHGGTVLVDHPKNKGTRVTMTLAIRQTADCRLCSPRMHIDYAGEWDHALLELADALPAEAYAQKL